MINVIWRLAYRAAFLGYLFLNAVRRPSTQGVLVAIWHEGHLLCVRNSYRWGWNLPGGMVRSGEDTAGAAVRELREEIGLRVDTVRLVHALDTRCFYENRHDSTRFYSLNLTERVGIVVDGREVTAAEWLLPADALTQGVIPPVRQYLESLVHGNACSAPR
ncbi:MAG: hypothetical protein VR70_11185 [Rhodospirillaceae bacterium BRH_c57]|nr:MAG: hypothetical protein VR70_11185 [Rhodospirillaceae bacterium BRH_c57]